MFKSFSKCLLVISSHHISNHCLHCWPGSNTKSPAGLRFSAPRNNIISASPSHPNTNKTWNTWNQPPKILHDFSKPSSLRKAFVAPSSWAFRFHRRAPGCRISRGDSEARLNLESLETGKCDPGGDWNPGRSIRIPFPKAQSFFRKLLPSAIHRIVVHNPGSRKQEEIWYWRWVRIFQTSFYVQINSPCCLTIQMLRILEPTDLEMSKIPAWCIANKRQCSNAFKKFLGKCYHHGTVFEGLPRCVWSFPSPELTRSTTHFTLCQACQRQVDWGSKKLCSCPALCVCVCVRAKTQLKDWKLLKLFFITISIQGLLAESLTSSSLAVSKSMLSQLFGSAIFKEIPFQSSSWTLDLAGPVQMLDHRINAKVDGFLVRLVGAICEALK